MADLSNPQHIRFMIKYCDTVPVDPRFALPQVYVQRLSQDTANLLQLEVTTNLAKIGINWEGPRIYFEVLRRHEYATTQQQVQRLVNRGLIDPNDIEVVLYDPLR